MTLSDINRHAVMYMARGDDDEEDKAEKAFITEMIAHHQHAVDMAKEILTKSSDATIQRLAKNIILSQQSEIGIMKHWLQQENSE